MALTPLTTWAKQTLTYQALNAEFLNIYNNPTSLISPATANIDLNGNSLIIDVDGDSSLRSSGDDYFDVRLQGFDAFVFDGSTASIVNGLAFNATATGTYPIISAQGENNIGINFQTNGDGNIQINGSILTGEPINASATWDPGSLADGAQEAKEVTATGAAMGDFVLVSFSLDLVDLHLTAAVSAADTVTCVLSNESGGTVDLASGTVYVRVLPRA